MSQRAFSTEAHQKKPTDEDEHEPRSDHVVVHGPVLGSDPPGDPENDRSRGHESDVRVPSAVSRQESDHHGDGDCTEDQDIEPLEPRRQAL